MYARSSSRRVYSNLAVAVVKRLRDASAAGAASSHRGSVLLPHMYPPHQQPRHQRVPLADLGNLALGAAGFGPLLLPPPPPHLLFACDENFYLMNALPLPFPPFGTVSVPRRSALNLAESRGLFTGCTPVIGTSRPAVGAFLTR